MEIFLIKALQLIACFSLLIILHEGGHFFFAKLFHVRVEKFCLFFDPWFTPIKWRPRHSSTTYCIGWLPLGGYVKIAGMVDESMDKEQLRAPIKPWEFRAKPAWQRLLIMTGGVLVNFIFAFLLYGVILFTWGETYVPITSYKAGFQFNQQAQSYGFRNGDILLGTSEQTFQKFDGALLRELSEASTVYVQRQGQRVAIHLPGDLNLLAMIKEQPPFVTPFVHAVVDSVMPASAAKHAGVLPGDTLVSFNGKAFTTVTDFQMVYGTYRDVLSTCTNHVDSSRLSIVPLVVRRSGGLDTLQLHLAGDYRLGVQWHSPLNGDYPAVTRNYGAFESLTLGAAHGWQTLCGYVDDLKYLFTADGAKSVGSFGAIGSMFPSLWDWCRFWELTAFISLMLAFMNLLPIPALDGGHVLFLLIEIIMRRKPSDALLERAQTIGMTLLLLLMAFAIFNDFRNFVF